MSSKTQVIAVCDASELKSGQMKQVDFGEKGKVLLSKLGNEIHATSAFCTHYGAPLEKGVLEASGRVTCPWHGACFNVCSGDIEDAPAPAALHKFTASVNSSDGKIYVEADPSLTLSDNKARFPAARVSKRTTTRSTPAGVVIVGGGSGALGTLIGLRESGYEGAITILTKEPHAPIDRTKLSKALLTSVPDLEWYNTSKIQDDFGAVLRTGTTVASIDKKAKSVKLEGGEEVKYDQLVLATGAIPRRLPIPGADLPHVYTLRGVEDAKKIDAALGKEGEGAESKKLVIIGSSFIGMELAVAASSRKVGKIHIIGMTKEPFEPVLGAEVGAAIRKFHEGKGTTFFGDAKCTEITPTNVTVETSSGSKQTLEADVVVMAVGVSPATDFLKDAFKLEKDGSIAVDEYLKVPGADGVYAIGDIATYPEPATSQTTRIEHWNVAQNHGRAVASAIAGKPLPFEKTPVFWSAQGQQLRYVGHAKDYDDVYLQGNADELKFVAYYAKGGKVLAVASMQSDPIAMKVSELMRLKKMPDLAAIRDGFDVLKIEL